MYIKRQADTLLQQHLSDKKVSMVLGARQVGKTTLLKHALQNESSCFLNFDVEIDRQRFLAAASLPPKEALKSFGNPQVLVVDEAQRFPETAQTVKGWFDSELDVKIFLLGSSSFSLLHQSVESLAGRNRKLFLPPLLFSEVLGTQDWIEAVMDADELHQYFEGALKALLLQSIAFGGYPEVVTVSDKVNLLQGLSGDYLWQDVLQMGHIKTPETIRRLLILLAHQIGSEVSVNELATQLGVTRPTIERYLDILEQSFVIFRLSAFSTNPRKEVCKSRKIYFWDTGIRNALLNEFSTSELRSDIGKLWENWLVSEIAKKNMLDGNPKQLYFWRSRSGSEVDVVIKDPEGALSAYEVKWRKKGRPVRAFSDRYDSPVIPVNSDNFLQVLLESETGR